MRGSIAYFAGAGTVVAAIAIGLGGGLVAGNIMSPQQPKQGPDTSKLESRVSLVQAAADTSAATAPAQASNPAPAGKADAQPVPYAEDTLRAGFIALPFTSGKPEQQQAAATPEVPPSPPPVAAASVQTQAAVSGSATTPTAAPSEQAAREPREQGSPENAYAKASSSDLKREACERRRAERHQRWVERHRQDGRERDWGVRDAREARQGPDWREPRAERDRTDWREVERSVREDLNERDVAARPRGFPQFRLFSDEDD